MNFSEWSKEKTTLVRIRRDVKNYLRKVAHTRGVTMYYLINEMFLKQYRDYKKSEKEQS